MQRVICFRKSITLAHGVQYMAVLLLIAHYFCWGSNFIIIGEDHWKARDVLSNSVFLMKSFTAVLLHSQVAVLLLGCFPLSLGIMALQFVRRWTLGELAPAVNHELYGHNYPVRSLAAGSCETLVSADAGGEVAVWRV
jgi:hypothetical protein